MAKSYSLQQDAGMRRYGSLININPSESHVLDVEKDKQGKNTQVLFERVKGGGGEGE